MNRSKLDRGWDTAWVDDDDEDADEDEGEEARSSQPAPQKHYFSTTEVLGDATRLGLSDIEEEGLGFDDHASGGYEAGGHGAQEQGAGGYEDSERGGSALDPAFLRPTGPEEDQAHDVITSTPDATSIRNVRWQTDEEEEEKEEALEEWRDGEPEPRMHTDYASVHTRLIQSQGQSPGPRRGSKGQCVNIMCRVRPPLPHERPAGGKGVVSVSGKGRIVIANPQVFGAAPEVVVGAAAAHNRLRGHSHRGDRAEDWARAFEFDRCFWSVSPKDGHFVDQRGVYVELGHSIATQALLHGVDVALFAYGASQSGKTYSILGPEEASLEVGNGPHEALGLLPRLLLTALQHVSSGSVVLSLSAVEFHSHADNSGLRDLLLGASSSSSSSSSSSPSSPSTLRGQTRRGANAHSNSNPNPYSTSHLNSNSGQPTPPPLRVREHPLDGPFVENLSVLRIQDTKKLQKVLRFLRRSLRLSDGPCHTLYTLYLDRTTDGGLNTTRVQCVELAAPSTLAHLPLSPRRPTDPFSRSASPPSSPPRPSRPFSPPSSPPRSPSTRQAPPSRTLPLTLTLLSRLLRHTHCPSPTAAPTPRSTPLTWLLSRTLLPSAARPSRCFLLLCLSPSAHAYADSLHTLKYGQDVCAPQPEEALVGCEGAQGGEVGASVGHYGASPIRQQDVGDWRQRTATRDRAEQEVEGAPVMGPPSSSSLLAGLSSSSSDRVCVRAVLKETVTDPQQRLARLQRALVAEEQGGKRQTACQTQLTGVEVVSRSSVASSEEVWALKAKVQHLAHDLQCAVLDRDVALSEARSAHDELKRVRGKEVKPASERARQAEWKLALAVEQREQSDAHARRVQEERDYVRQLLEETKARHLTQLQAMELRRVEAETRAAHADPTPAGTASTPPHATQVELDSMQTRVLRAEAECEEARSLLWDHKAKLTQLTHAKIEVETNLAIVTEELESTRAKLQQQSRALFALQKQHASSTTTHPPLTHKTVPPPASACPRASPPPLLPSPSRSPSAMPQGTGPLDRTSGTSAFPEGCMGVSLGASDWRTRRQLAETDMLSPPAQPSGVVDEMGPSGVGASTSGADPSYSTWPTQSQHVVGQLEDLEVQQEAPRRRPSPITAPQSNQVEATPQLSPSPLRHGQPSPTPWQQPPSPKQKQQLNQKKPEPFFSKPKQPLNQKKKSEPPSPNQKQQPKRQEFPSPKPRLGLSGSLKSPTQTQPLRQSWEMRTEEDGVEGVEELKETLRLKDSIILQQSHEARTLAETLQRRVMSLERVAVLEGAALKEGLRREAQTLSRELRGWSGRRSKAAIEAHANGTAAALEAPAVATPGSQAAASGSAYDVTSPPYDYDVASPRHGDDTEALITTLQDTVASLREDKARLEERVSLADQRAAKAMEDALVEVLMGVKDENARVREAVDMLGQDKQRAEQRLLELQKKQAEGVQDYGRMFRQELAALWVTLKGEGQQEQAVKQMHKEMETLRAKTQRLGKENAGLRQELAATTRPQPSPSPARPYAHFQKTQGLHSSLSPNGASPSRRPYSAASTSFPPDDASLGTQPSRGRHHQGADGPLPSLSLPKDFSSVMAAACLDDPDAIEQAVQFEIELALQSLLASRRAEAASHSQRDARRPPPPPPPNGTDAAQGARDRRPPPPPPPPDTSSNGDWSQSEGGRMRETLLGRKRKQRPSMTGGATSGAVTQTLASTGGGGESRRGSTSNYHSHGFASITRSQALRQEASDKRPPAVGRRGSGAPVGVNWAAQSYPVSGPAGRAGAEGLYASVPKSR